ncbi:MAG: transcriptional repressor [Ruminococcaceae bacterium]|nr:transcriptional repressor [Oscillospiraceae bacterium]
MDQKKTNSTPKKTRNTQQKQLILETLRDMGSHVSAGAIFKELQSKHPGIGRATVFRVLSDMADNGTIFRVRTVEGEDRYDITSFDHCHVICRKCGKVDDVWFDSKPEVFDHIKSSSDFKVEKTHIEFIGLCKQCAKGQ